MSDTFSLLVREVERLVTAPYVPALQDLYGIVRRCSPAEIGAWAFCKPCQVGLLVDVLLEALSRSAVSLQLLCHFASNSSFRDALLKRHPAALDTFLQNAIEYEDPEYFSVCTALLLSPLPPDFTAPARLSPFIMKLVCKMGENPCEKTIVPLYQLMTGLQASSSILDTVPSEAMDTLQVELTKTLRNLDDHMGNLLCLATFARIASSRRKDIGTDNGFVASPAWLQSIRHFFGPKRALKTLELVVLRVILACSDSCNNLPVGRAAESIRLAVDICSCVEPEQRKIWISGNSPKISKLFDKVNRNGICHEVRMMGAAFLVTLLPADALPHQITSLCQQGLLSKDSRCVLETVPREFIPRMVEAVAISFGEPAVREFLRYSFFVMKEKVTADYESLAAFHLAKSFLSGLQDLGPRLWSSSTDKLVLTMDEVTVDELLSNFPRKPCQQQCDGSEACYAAISASQNSLLVDLLDFHCRHASSQKMDNENSNFAGLANLLVAFMTQMRDRVPDSSCAFSILKQQGTRDIFSYSGIRNNLPDSRPTHDWRTGMAETLMLNARASHESMMKKVEEICYDLEHRCYNTEAPLRAVEEERDLFRLEAERLNQENDGLKAQLHQAFVTVSDLQKDMARLENHAERASRRSDEVSANLNDAQKEIEDQRRHFEETIQAEREKARTSELDLIATMTEREDQLEELQGELREQKAKDVETRNTLVDTLTAKTAALEDVSLLKQEVAELQHSLEGSIVTSAQKDEEAKRLITDKEGVISEAKNLESKLAEEASECSRLKSAMQAAEEKSRIDMETLKQKHELALSHAASESAKQREEGRCLQVTMHETATNAAKEHQTKDQRIQHLENKIQSLRDERAAKAREFSEAQQYIGRLMGVMGFKTDMAETKHSNKQRRSKSRLEPSQAPFMMPQQDTNTSFTPGEADSTCFLGESFGPVNSSSPGGRSSKRPRSNFGLPDATPTPLRPNDPSSCDTKFKSKDPHYYPRSSIKQRRERRPLGDTGTNDRPTSSQGRHTASRSLSGHTTGFDGIMLDENRGINLDDMEVDFEQDLILTSTAISETNDRSLLTQDTQE